MRLSLLRKDELKGCTAADWLSSGVVVVKSRGFSLAVLWHGGFLFQRGEDLEVLHLFVDAVFRVEIRGAFHEKLPQHILPLPFTSEYRLSGAYKNCFSQERRSDEKSCSNDGVIGSRPCVEQAKFTSQSLPRKMASKSFSVASEHVIPADTSTAQQEIKTSDTPAEEEHPSPPPKPSRVPSFKVKPRKPPQVAPLGERLYAEIDEGDEDENRDRSSTDDLKTPTSSSEAENNVKNTEEIIGSSTLRHSRLSETYQPSGSDSGNGSGDSVQTSASDAQK
ncbi:hypothetical protein E2C01_046138 [Portunus trituberculatus]|uniref:Uncharacterized protein n=1 Tax=Portunus trituberculatus TaxID=210409 RepID=A0A5B7G6T7_PORTR|nr:hypothetical protein [Portunus trituberculatus]